MAGFLSPLKLEYLDGRSWRVIESFAYHLGAPDGPESIQIPIGFITDFASVPRMLWAIFPPTGGYGKAAVVHDWLYQFRIVTCVLPDGIVPRLVDRGEADAILNEAMAVLGVGRVTRWMISRGVRVGGWVAWRRYRAAEQDV